jgi:uncharacterized protein
MRIVISGASGLIGSELAAAIREEGHTSIALVRRQARTQDEIGWDPARDEIDAAALEGVDAVVHLAGENVAAGRWSTRRKQTIRESRVRGTRLLAQTLARLVRKPSVMVSASAIGFYGDRGVETLTEESPPGSGFLPDVVRAWEEAARPAADAGIRVAHPRIGVVLSGKGGALAKMLKPFRLGAGGVVGAGDQYMSWIALEDVVRSIRHAISAEALAGPFNAVAPNPATNREFTKALGAVLRRPTVLPLPAAAVRIALGEMGRDLLLASTRVAPARLLASGFRFAYPDLDAALRAALAPV